MFQKFTPKEYVKIDIANAYGHDKISWMDRINWFDVNHDNLDEMIQSAKEPAMFYAGLQAWRDVQFGRPSGYMISLDATSSGIQILAALTGDRRAAQLCNVVDHGMRMDAYTELYTEMLREINDTSKINRDDTKQAIMTAFYASKAEPERVFGEGELLDTFYRTLQLNAPGAWEANEAFLSMWDPTALSHDWVLPDNFHVQVKVMGQVKETVNFLNQPFDVFYNVNTPIQEGRSLGANVVHSIDGMIVREMTRRCDYDVKKIDYLKKLLNSDFEFVKLPADSSKGKDNQIVHTLWENYKNSGYLSARILEHLWPENMWMVHKKIIKELLDSLPEKPFKVISIHDCFRCHPNYGNDLRVQYNRQLMEIARSNLLQNLVSQIVGRKVSVYKLDKNLWKDIMDSNYALS